MIHLTDQLPKHCLTLKMNRSKIYFHLNRCALYMYNIITCIISVYMYVVVQFYFLLFWGMIMYMDDNEFETKKTKKFKRRIKLNHNIDNMLHVPFKLYSG